MFKSEKIFLFLLISACVVISLVVVDALMDPALLIRTAYARFSGSEVPESEQVYQPDFSTAAEPGQLLGEAAGLLQDGWNLYRSEGFAFEIQYPQQVEKKSILNQDALNAGVGVESTAPVWQFRLDDQSLYQGTNLIDASVLIHVLEGKDQETACSSFKEGSLYQTPSHSQDEMEKVEINGVSFWKDEVLEGVMGEFYHRVSYRTFSKGACYEITELVHYQNMDSIFDENVLEFDQERVLSALDEVTETFAFLDVEPTFPEQSYPVPKTLSTAVSKATTDYVDGLDVSHWQGTINWPKVANAGYVFTFAKGTEGVGWTDVKFHENMVNGTNAGVMMGVYHFARPDLGNSAVDEANHFLEVSGDYLKSGYLRPVLDLEVGSSLGKTALSNWVIKWMQTVENRTGISPLIYTNPNFINNYLTSAVTEYDLWVAHWTCTPTPSYYYPNTGMWRDWAFWQYYGPGGCGGNAGYVPGITTNIDLNIFNGVESGLAEYDASSHLWVSLTSDAYYYPAPYYADITGNVNGDTTGPIDFAFWWDCTSLESDLATVEGSCGELPEPDPGACEYNDVGMRCIEVDNEKQIAEHTYQEIGNYTAKVIVDRGGEPSVEDRYQISTYNPLRLLKLTPVSPGLGVIEEPYLMAAAVTLHTSVSGALQVELMEEVSGLVRDTQCIPVISDNESIETFDFSWTETKPLQKNYEVWARYRPNSACPIEDESENDLVKYYQVYWMDEQAVLEVRDSEDNYLPDAGVIDLGDVEPFQVVQLPISVSNPSTLLGLEILAADFENLSNVANLQLEPTFPLEVGPEGEEEIQVSFEVQSSGPFSFDVVLDHDASNPTPFRFTAAGSGVLSDNPIQLISVDPASPGEGLIGDPYDLHIDVQIDPPVEGVLQVGIEDAQGSPVGDTACLAVPEKVLDSYGFDFTWSGEVSGQQDYLISARYREYGSCPVEDSSAYDITQGYRVDWVEDSPILFLQNPDLESISQGEADDLGELGAYQLVERVYQISNPSATSSFQITEVTFTDVANLVDISTTAPLPLEIEPEGQASLAIQFEVEDPGEFSANIELEHTASNPTPFDFSIQGSGILLADPIQSVTPQPLSPGQILVSETFSLQVAAEIDAPVAGALEISVADSEGSPVEQPYCEVVSGVGESLVTYQLEWSEDQIGLKDYAIEAAFYSRSDCPVSGTPLSNTSLPYQVDWQEETPELELLNQQGSLLNNGGVVDLGQYEYYQQVTLSYQLHNTSSTSPLEITEIGFENLSNINQVELESAASLVLDPDSTADLQLSLLVDLTGDFSFDLVIGHNGSNPSPYRVTFEGSGVMTDNPLKYVSSSPSSPGTSLIGTPFSLDVEVGLDVPDQGALQVSMKDKASGALADRSCQNLVDNLDQPRTLSLVLNQSAPGTREYTLSVQYRAQGDCPIEDIQEGDLSQTYAINWEEQVPSLEVFDADGSSLTSGLILDLEEQEFYQQVELTYLLHNTSSTTDLEIDSLSVDDLTNVDQVSITPSGPITLLPGEEQEVTLSFRVARISTFSLGVQIDHSGENPSPFSFTIAGTGVLSVDPIISLTTIPQSPGNSFITEEYNLQVQVEIDPPAPGVLQVTLNHQDSSGLMGDTCFEILGEHSFVDMDLTWEEANPGDMIYDLGVSYQALGSCPLEGQIDAEYTEYYEVAWSTHEPELIVNRPEGVTIFDGAVDYIGVHDFFRFVEVTYLITNGNDAGPLVINSITPENLVNLREVLIEPAGVIEIQPGESQEIVISFQVLTLDPYSFDLVWDHSGSNPSPYVTGIMGDAKLNLGAAPSDSWLYRFLESLIRSGFFLKLPIFGLVISRRKRKKSSN